MDRKGTITPPFSEYLTVEQVATILNVSTDTVARQFGKMEGVIDLGTPERLHKRRRRILRIPATGWSGSSLSGRFVVVANNRFAVVWRGIDYSGAESPDSGRKGSGFTLPRASARRNRFSRRRAHAVTGRAAAWFKFLAVFFGLGFCSHLCARQLRAHDPEQ
jgi:hypothetical protein